VTTNTASTLHHFQQSAPGQSRRLMIRERSGGHIVRPAAAGRLAADLCHLRPPSKRRDGATRGPAPARAPKASSRVSGHLPQVAPAEARHDHGVKRNIQEQNAERKIDAVLFEIG
jgi:hypothetical protein